MKTLLNASIKTKQHVFAMLTSGVALLLAFAAILTYEIIGIREDLSKNIGVLAEATAYNSATALDFEDQRAGTDILAALRANNSVVAAAILDSSTEVFATYFRDGKDSFHFPFTESNEELLSGFDNGYYNQYYPIKSGVTGIGFVYLAADTEIVKTTLQRDLILFSLVYVICLLVVRLLSGRMHQLVSAPILHLTELSRKVAENKDYSLRATKKYNDELGDLVDDYNDMLSEIQSREKELLEAHTTLERRVQERTGELETIHLELVKASRQAGMAEIATNVLHNVGNVLNSLNVSAGIVFDKLKASRVDKLSQVVSILESRKEDLEYFLTQDPKGKNIAPYLSALSKHLTEERDGTLEEIKSLRENVDHIKNIVRMQQDISVVSGFMEAVDPCSLIDDCLKINQDSIHRRGVKVHRQFQALPPVTVDKHKFIQILNNLVRNALHACEESNNKDNTITITAERKDPFILIHVADTGVGIPPENKVRIFNHGFTTRPNGHGFGLHSGALAAKEMGGALSVQSEGVGNGATFTLSIPVPLPEQAPLPAVNAFATATPTPDSSTPGNANS